MKLSRIALLLSIVAFSAASYADQLELTIPSGTVLPIQLNTTVKSNKANPGEKITGEVMQDVPLPGGAYIPRGSKVIGRVIAAKPASAENRGEVSLRFDTVATKKQNIAVNTHVRALASMMAVSEAQVPESGPDRGTPSYIWTTDLIGGQVNYHGDAVVTQGNAVVGRSTPYGVLVHPSTIPDTHCHGDSDQLQAFWVFSSYACGVYGYGDLALLHAGRTAPRGEITLRAGKGNVNLRSGSGMLLRVQ